MRKSKIKIKPNIPRSLAWRLIFGQSFTFYTPRPIKDCYYRILQQHGNWGGHADTELQTNAHPTHRNRATFKFESISSNEEAAFRILHVCITGTLVEDDTHTRVKGNTRISWGFRLFSVFFITIWPLIWILGGFSTGNPLLILIGLAGIVSGLLLLLEADIQAQLLYQELHELLNWQPDTDLDQAA